jgi:nucleoside-diphosphate-sugar epimerase
VAAVALITGATGLIGRHLVNDWAVSGLEPVPVGSGDDLLAAGVPAALVARVRPAVVVHLAWTASGTAGYRQDARNTAWVTASAALAQASIDSGAWFVGTGTAVDASGDPPDPYTAAKVRLRRLLAPLIDQDRCSWVRPFYVVDPDLGRPALVAAARRARTAGEPLELLTPGSRHDFVLAADVADAVRTVVEHRLPGKVDVGSGELRRVADLVTALGTDWVAAPGAPDGAGAPAAAQHHETADIGRLRDLGWTAHRTALLLGPGRSDR